LNHARTLKTLLLLLVAASTASTSIVHAEPLPHAVSCVLTIGDTPVQDHLLVEAKIDGILYAATHTKDGRFGYDPGRRYWSSRSSPAESATSSKTSPTCSTTPP